MARKRLVWHAVQLSNWRLVSGSGYFGRIWIQVFGRGSEPDPVILEGRTRIRFSGWSDPDLVIPEGQTRIRLFRRLRPGSGFLDGQTRIWLFRSVRPGSGYSGGSDPDPVFWMVRPGSGYSGGPDPDPVILEGRTRIQFFWEVINRIRLFWRVGPGSGQWQNRISNSGSNIWGEHTWHSGPNQIIDSDDTNTIHMWQDAEIGRKLSFV